MVFLEELSGLTTESVNPNTVTIDENDAFGIVQLLHEENARVHSAVQSVLPLVAQAVDLLVDTMASGERMVYIGAGTSGRLGILDASEMPPTFGVGPTLVGGIIAGGPNAVFTSVEGAEDSPETGASALMAYDTLPGQPVGMVIGLSASGRTPFVLGALEYAAKLGKRTVLVSTNKHEVVRAFAPYTDLTICAEVGPEPITGSTRLKSGTAQKLIINMITTGAMVRLGKTYGNVMIDVQPTNIKLRNRAIGIVCTLAGTTREHALQLLEQAEWNVKVATVLHVKQCSAQQAREMLHNENGRLKSLIGDIH